MPKIEIKIWNFFEKSRKGNKIAICNYCHRELSYKTTVSNLKSHLKTKHTDVYNNAYSNDSESESTNVIYIAEFDDDENIEELLAENSLLNAKTRKRNVPIWNFFQESMNGNRTAVCNYCLRELSYKTTITNLKTHLKQKHISVYNEFLSLTRTSNVSPSPSDDEATLLHEEVYVENMPTETKMPKGDLEIWSYFEKSSNGNKTAVCNYCIRDVTYNNEVSNLKLHLKVEHIELYNKSFNSSADISENLNNSPSPADDGELSVEYLSQTKRRKRDVPIWKFFEPTREGNKTAICNSCGRKLSYRTTITNLKSHLQQKHIDIYNVFLNLSGTTSENVMNSPSLSESDFEDSYTEDPCSDMKKRKRDESIWIFFERSNDGDKTAICKCCRREISYRTSITSLKAHLKQKHNAAYTKLLNLSTTADVNTSFFNYEELLEENGDGGRKTARSGSAEAGMWLTDDSNNDEPLRKIKKIVRMDLTDKLKTDNKKQIDLSLLKMIIYDYQPFSIVDDIGFRAYTQALNPYYKIPDQKTLSVNLLSEVYEKRLEEVKEFVNIHAMSVCITIDCWTSSATDNYMSITAHFVTEDPVELNSILIECSEFDDVHDGTSIYKKIKNILENWGIHDKVNFIVTNNGHGMENAAKYFEIEGWSYFVCFAHKLNIVVEEVLADIKDTINKVRKIVNYILKCNTAEQDLLKYQKNKQEGTETKSVIESTPARWNTVYLMLQRFVELKESLLATILHSETNLPIIAKDEWRCLEQICVILKPFHEATIEMGVDKYLFASKAFILTSNLINICNNYSGLQELHPLARAFASKLKDGMTNQFGSLETNEAISLCTILDPRFKLKGIKNKERVESLKNKIRKFLDEMNQENGNDSDNAEALLTSDPATLQTQKSDLAPFSLWCEFDEENKISNDTNDELEGYLAGSSIKRTECPLKYWQQCKCVYPNLFKLFMQHCNIMVTSVPCEQVFSGSGYIISHRRTQLTATNAAQIVFLHANKM